MPVRTENPPRHAEERTVPEVMNAAAIDHFGGPEVLTLHRLPVPTLDHGEVLIALHAAGVGSWDADMRAGWHPDGKPKFPLVLGTDGAGTVAAMGAHVRRFRVGEAVYSYSFNNPKGGFYAEYVAVDADKVAPVPRGLDFLKAGAIPTTGLTAIQGIDDALQVKSGEQVIIHGGSGGVGTLAIQFAKLRGASVLATASGEDGLALVRKLGADVAVDGRSGNIAAAARAFAPNGVDAVLGLAGGEAFEACIEAVRVDGRVAWPNGVEPSPGKRHGIRMVAYDAIAGVREFQHLGTAIEAAQLEVPITAKFSLADAAKAHQRLSKEHVRGKIVLRVR